MRLTTPQLQAILRALEFALDQDGVWSRTYQGPRGPYDLRAEPAWVGAEREARVARNAYRAVQREVGRRRQARLGGHDAFLGADQATIDRVADELP